jgi:hypothetical protein
MNTGVEEFSNLVRNEYVRNFPTWHKCHVRKLFFFFFFKKNIGLSRVLYIYIYSK